MVLDLSAIDSMATIVLAIRGTQSFKDWLVNMKTEPKKPVGFLDDSANACHAGFLEAHGQAGDGEATPAPRR